MEHILSLSYGKDSLACLGAMNNWAGPDRIAHAEVWATDTVPADLPPMVDFKKHTDKVIKERYGFTVEHITAVSGGKRVSYESIFYKRFTKGDRTGRIYGFPMLVGSWCNSRLKMAALKKTQPKESTVYIGIAADEPTRFHNLSSTKKSPLVEAGWTEEDCRNWCEEHGLLSPIYATALRGGCWFCHQQSVGQLRILRRDYPELWALMLKWDSDSPVKFKPDGHTVHDYDLRFKLEDEHLVSPGREVSMGDAT